MFASAKRALHQLLVVRRHCSSFLFYPTVLLTSIDLLAERALDDLTMRLFNQITPANIIAVEDNRMEK